MNPSLELIERVKETKGLRTDQEFATAVRITRPYVSLIRKGQQFSEEKIIEIAEYAGFDPVAELLHIKMMSVTPKAFDVWNQIGRYVATGRKQVEARAGIEPTFGDLQSRRMMRRRSHRRVRNDLKDAA